MEQQQVSSQSQVFPQTLQNSGKVSPVIRIVGLVGHKQCGKDTVWSIISKLSASYLTQCPCFRFAFADGVKSEVAAKLGTTKEWLNEHKNDPLIRHVLQWYGTDYKRYENENYWIEQLSNEINTFKRLSERCIILVITDVRFLNEAAFIKAQGGTLIRIRRKLSDDVCDPHISEQQVDEISCDNFIHNDSSMLRLEFEVKDVMKQLNLLK